MTEQIQTQPKFFDVQKHFGPFFANVQLADDVTNALIKMTDKIIDDKKSESHGQSLFGAIEKELKVYKSDMDEFGVDQMIRSCLKLYNTLCQKCIKCFMKLGLMHLILTLHGLYLNMRMNIIHYIIILVVM